jgi:hypothetical protein
MLFLDSSPKLNRHRVKQRVVSHLEDHVGDRPHRHSSATCGRTTAAGLTATTTFTGAPRTRTRAGLSNRSDNVECYREGLVVRVVEFQITNARNFIQCERIVGGNEECPRITREE